MKLAKVIGVLAVVALIAAPVMAQPANDMCAGAIPIACGGSASADSTGGTDDVGQPAGSCWGGPTDESMYFTFVPTATSATLSTCNSLGGDSAFAVFAVDAADPCNFAAWTEMPCGGCAEDAGCGPFGFDSSICVDNLVVGQTYYIMLKNWGAPGVYTVDLDCTACGATATGACCDTSTGATSVTTQCLCTGKQGFRYDGDGTAIGDVPCGPGACCETETGVCNDPVFQSDCIAMGAGWRYGGDGTTCAPGMANSINPPCKALIPTVSEWGLVLMTLIGLTVGTILFNRRRVAVA